jgi:hypothetical protein
MQEGIPAAESPNAYRPPGPYFGATTVAVFISVDPTRPYHREARKVRPHVPIVVSLAGRADA